MARKPVHSFEEREEWWRWYKEVHGRTAQMTADHFNVPVTQVRRHFHNHPTTDEVDPYPATLERLEKAFHWGHDNSGAMNDYELNLLIECHLACISIVERLDPASIELIRGNA
jgi:hypothetical protein